MAIRTISTAFISLVTLLFGFDCIAAGRPVVVPITIRGNFPIVEISIDGHVVPVIVDLGNSGFVALSQSVLDHVHATPTGKTSKAMDPKGNAIEYPKFKIPHLQLGTIDFTDVTGELDVHDPTYQPRQMGQQGFLGTALLKAYRVVLDYPHRTMTLIPPDSADQLTDCKGTAVPFAPAWHGEPVTEVGTDLGPVTLWWDTGAPTSVLSKKFVESMRPHHSVKSVTTRLTLGGTDFGALRMEIWDLSLPPGFSGFIGYNFFAHHIACVDFPANRLLIQH